MPVGWHPPSGRVQSTECARRSSHFYGPFVTHLGAKRMTVSAAGNSRHTFFFARPYLLHSRWETIPAVWTLAAWGNAMRVMSVGLAHINQCQLAKRWNMSPRTLERWRWLGQGPVFLKLGDEWCTALRT